MARVISQVRTQNHRRVAAQATVQVTAQGTGRGRTRYSVTVLRLPLRRPLLTSLTPEWTEVTRGHRRGVTRAAPDTGRPAGAASLSGLVMSRLLIIHTRR